MLTLAAFVTVIMLRIGYGLMADRKTAHPFEPQEMARWNRVQRLTRVGIAPLPVGDGTS